MITLHEDDDSDIESCCVTSDARHPRAPYLCWAIELSTVFFNMVYKRVCRNCLISSCEAKYLVRLANHLADVHQLDHIQRRQYLQEAKLQPKVKVVVYKRKADNSGKNHSTSTLNPVQAQETVYKLSRSRRNEASFKEKAKRTTTKNKTKRKKQRKSNSWLRNRTEKTDL